MQTAYNSFPPNPRAGSLADLNESIIVTRFSDANMPFGRLVVLDASTADSRQMVKVKLPSSAASVYNSDNYQLVEGIVVVTQAQQAEYGLSPVSALPEYLSGQPINVIRHGIVWVYVEEAVTPADQPYVRHTAGSASYAGTLPGNFNKGTDSSNSVTLAGNVRFMQSTSGAGLVPVMIRL